MADIEYSLLTDFYEKIESTSSRLAMTDLLVALLKRTPPEVIDKLVYLTRGVLGPDYEAPELGVAEKLALKAVAQALGISQKEVDEAYKRLGDIGLVVEDLMSKRKSSSLFDFFGDVATSSKPLTISRVYDSLVKVAKAAGPGAQDTKIM
ncbi:MAG: DNA ligase, partial [Thermofilaceae archaeon]